MEKILQLNFYLILISFISLISASEYVLSPMHDDIFKRCPGYENDFLDKYFDLSELKFTRISEEVIEASGIIKFIGDLPKDVIIKLEAKFYKKVLGEWVESVSIVREDLCLVLYSKSELWYPLAKQIKEEDRVCPLNVGWQTELKNVPLIFKFDGGLLKNGQGEYKAITTFQYKNQRLCILVFGSLELD